MSKQELAVGDSTDLEIIFSTGRRSGSARKSPTIQTNEGPPDRKVTIKSHVIAQPDSTYPIVINPFRVNIPRLGTEDLDEGVFTITNVSDEDLELSVVSKPYGYFGLETPSVVKAGESVDCLLKVNKEHLASAWQKSITLELSGQAKSRFTIPVIRKLIGSDNKVSTTAKNAPVKKPGGSK